jgi:ATP-dependent exoDNAse (exonuclease V) alpha subunit
MRRFNVKRVNYREELEKEKEKLERLVNEALKNGIPIIQDEAVMAQSRRVDKLLNKFLKEKEGQKNNG